MLGSYRQDFDPDLTVDTKKAPGGVIVYYADGGEEIIHVNDYIVDLLECDDVDDFLELVHGSFKGLALYDDIEVLEDSIVIQSKRHDGLVHVYYRVRTKTGKAVNVEGYGRLQIDDSGRPRLYAFITEAEKGNSIDWLTGLPGMTRFHQLARAGAEIIEMRGERPVAVALDLVGMKSFNTQYGREEGDNLLRVFAQILRRRFGIQASSRFAEDHYYAYASEKDVEKTLKAVFDDFSKANEGKVLPVRSGAYACNPGEDIIDVGFDRAKIACDLDRKTWKSHVMWFKEEMRADTEMRMYILDHIEQAISERWIYPYYQAIVRAATGNLCGEEALARWVDPKYGLLSPAHFIPVLEEAGLIHRLDMHMVDCVVSDMARKQEEGIDVEPVSVNISLKALGNVNLAEKIASKVDAGGIDRYLLRVEFTESAASENPEAFRIQVNALREAGFQVWMDDFGSGNSSLYTLKQFDFDLIKLDMGLISGPTTKKLSGIVSGTVQIARKLGLGVLAEGVETEEQAAFLRDVGCDMMQGYLYSKPLALDDVIDHFKAGAAIVREDPSEADFWNIVGSFDIDDPSASIAAISEDDMPTEQFPGGILEQRGNLWRLVRANKPYIEMLKRGGLISKKHTGAKPFPFGKTYDQDVLDAAARSVKSGKLERVNGNLEVGMGLRFYIHIIASAPGANAFAMTSVASDSVEKYTH